MILTILHNNINIVKKLIHDGEDVNEKDRERNTALALASDKGYERIVEMLLNAGANLDTQNINGITAIMRASYNGYWKIVKMLIKAGANLNLQDKNGNTALILTLHKFKDRENVAEMLIKAGADLNLQDKNGNTALILASDNGNEKIVEMLLKNIAKIDLQNNDGDTALIRASYNGHRKVVEMLIKAGANRNVQNNNGDTTLTLISFEPRSDITDKDSEKIVEALIKAGTNLDLQNIQGLTALMNATLSGRTKIAELLIKAGANVNLQDVGGYTALMSASASCQTEDERNVEMLIKAGAKLDLQDKYGNTALINASNEGEDYDKPEDIKMKQLNRKIIMILIRAGADVNIKNYKDISALKFYVQKLDFEMVKFILRYSPNLVKTSEVAKFLSLQENLTVEKLKMLHLLENYRQMRQRLVKNVMKEVYKSGRRISYKLNVFDDSHEKTSFQCLSQEYKRDDLIQMAWKFYRSTNDKNKVIFINIFGKSHDIADIGECQRTKKTKGLDVCAKKILIRMTDDQLCQLFELKGGKFSLRDPESMNIETTTYWT